MSEYAYGFDDLRGDILGVMQSMSDAHAAQQKLDEAMAADLERVWGDIAELRDDINAVANRLENLTRAVTTSPAEVAAAIVNDANRETLRAVGPFPKDERMILSPLRWHECSECGTDIRRGASDGLIYDAEGLHTCKASA